jgi:hypothetical protein
MIDKMLFVLCYGYKVIFAGRVPHASILAFRSCALKNARENESNFYHLWKDYLKRNRSGKNNGGAEVAQEVTARVNDVTVMGDGDEAAPAEAPTGRCSR